jgi:hypothetical protein
MLFAATAPQATVAAAALRGRGTATRSCRRAAAGAHPRRARAPEAAAPPRPATHARALRAARSPAAPRRRASALTPPAALPSAAGQGRSPSPPPRRAEAVSIRPGETPDEAARRASGGGGGPGGSGQEPEGGAEPALLMRLKAQSILESIDETGAWTVLSALLAFGTFLLETLNEVRPAALLFWFRRIRIGLTRAPYSANRTTLGAGTCCTATTCRCHTA